MERRQFYSSLEVARGVAALMVALFHVGQLTYLSEGIAKPLIPRIQEPFTWSAQIARILGNGPGAVIFFFVLSGFVLTMVLERSRASIAGTTIRFVTARVFRIFPAVWCTLGVFYFFFGVFGRSIAPPVEYEPSKLLLNALLIIKSIDGVMWSMQLELAAVPLLLAVYFGWRRYGFRVIFWTYVVLLGLSFFGWWSHLVGDPGQFGQIYAFLAGMTVFLYGRKYVVALKRPWILTAVAIFAFLVTRHIVGWSSSFTYFFEATFASSIVALLAFGTRPPENAIWFRALQFVGRVSFSFYLLHPLAQTFSREITPLTTIAVQAGISSLVLAYALLLVSTAAVLPLAWLQYRLVEVPMIAAGKGLFVSKQQPSEAVA
ncbi:acyltransferase family protein [Tardiphaga robiniae]|uniref:acyltransferase family protein n=1 Tax=Tardiphaga robiniae TaxID=943830 RepID=UPI001586D2F1|nr:acyltransferase [Tardiphaga robiniae]NUU40371.1 acyltransferase [Tardiphaga robiniae]